MRDRGGGADGADFNTRMNPRAGGIQGGSGQGGYRGAQGWGAAEGQRPANVGDSPMTFLPNC